MTEPSSSVKQKILLEVARTPAPTRREERLRRGVWVAGAAMLGVWVAFWRGLPRPSPSRPLAYVLVSALTAGTIAWLSSMWVFGTQRRSTGRPRLALSATMYVVPIVLTAGVLGAHAAAPGTWQGWEPVRTADALCAVLYLAFGSGLLVVFLVGIRPLDPVAPGTTGATLGAVAGAWTTVAIGLQCPGTAPGHVLLTHVWPVVLLVFLGGASGRRVLTVHYRKSE